MGTKKYKLTEETIIVNDKSLYRIEALKDFGNVKKGDKGGFVENEDNLSQYDDCWVYGNAKVYHYADVCGDDGVVWSSSFNTSYPYSAWYLVFNSGVCGMYGILHYFGRSIRPVTD